MSRLRMSGRGIATAASALIHGGVVWALLPSLTGSAAPTPDETPMAVEMAGFATPTDAVDTAEPLETAQAQPAEPTETVPTETAPTEAAPTETAQEQPVETVVAEPPPPADMPPAETSETEPPQQAPDEPPPEVVTTTGETEAVVAAVPETVQAVEPEMVQPPPTRPKPRAERQPPRRQPRPAAQPTEAPARTASLPPQAAAPPSAPAASAAEKADYAAQLQGYLGRRVRNVSTMVRQQMIVGATVTIEADGTLSAIEMTRSSGSDSIDGEILRKLRSASPVPAPPARLANLFIPFRIDPAR